LDSARNKVLSIINGNESNEELLVKDFESEKSLINHYDNLLKKKEKIL